MWEIIIINNNNNSDDDSSAMCLLPLSGIEKILVRAFMPILFVIFLCFIYVLHHFIQLVSTRSAIFIAHYARNLYC